MEQKCTLTDQELIEACDSLVGNLAAGTEKWRMSVPVNFNRDSDMLLSEVISRFKERIATPSPAKAEQEGLRWVDIKDSTPRDGVYSVKCTDWVSGVTMLGVGNIVGGEWVLVTFLNKTTFGKSEILACGKVEYLDESTTPPVKEEDQKMILFRELPEPVGKFIEDQADVPYTQTEQGAYWHYVDVITLLTRYRKYAPPVKEAGQPVDNIGREEELIYRIVEQWGNTMCSISEMVQWLKDYAAQSRQRTAGESAVWVKVSKRLPVEDGYVCLKVNGGYMGAFVRTMTPPGSNGVRWITDSGGHTIRNWKQAEWLDESGLASSREREVAIAFAEWINRQPYLFGQNDYGWYYDIPVDGAGVEHKLIGDTNDLYDLYLQSSSNT